MQKFLGTCFHEHGADDAWFVTTTSFSKAARDLGTRRGVTLVDRSALAEWMARTAITPIPTPGPRRRHQADPSETATPAAGVSRNDRRR